MTESTTQFSPAGERVRSIDVARGVSLLGILLMNIIAFAAHFSSYGDPTALGEPSPLDLRLFEINFVLFEGKMRAIFSLLFGAGIILFTTRELAHGRGASADLYYRRNLWLIVFGILHGFVLLWPGDILFTYGVTALFLYVFRNARPRMLLSFAAACLLVNLFFTTGRYDDFTKKQKAAATADSIVAAGGTLTQKQLAEKVGYQKVADEMKPSAAAIEEHNAKMRGSWPTVAGYVAPILMLFQSKYFYFSFFWDAAMMMLIGMAMYRFGMLTLEFSRRTYVVIALVAYAIGIPLGWFVLQVREGAGFALDQSLAAEWFTYELRRISMVVGHVAVIMLVAGARSFNFITSPLAAVGRMAFTNYIMQTVICTIVFYGYGFGLHGTMSRAEMYQVVLAIWIVQLVVSPLWLRYFRFGPLEWAWRSLTYWQRQPMRRERVEPDDEILPVAA